MLAPPMSTACMRLGTQKRLCRVNRARNLSGWSALPRIPLRAAPVRAKAVIPAYISPACTGSITPTLPQLWPSVRGRPSRDLDLRSLTTQRSMSSRSSTCLSLAADEHEEIQCTRRSFRRHVYNLARQKQKTRTPLVPGNRAAAISNKSPKNLAPRDPTKARIQVHVSLVC
jgi:hypothetical protein